MFIIGIGGIGGIPRFGAWVGAWVGASVLLIVDGPIVT